MFPGKFQPKETESPVLEQPKMEKPDVSRDDEDGLMEWNPEEGCIEKKPEIDGKKPDVSRDDEDGLMEWSPEEGCIERKPDVYRKTPDVLKDGEDGLMEWSPEEGCIERKPEIDGKKPDISRDDEDGLMEWSPEEGFIEKKSDVYRKTPDVLKDGEDGLREWHPDEGSAESEKTENAPPKQPRYLTDEERQKVKDQTGCTDEQLDVLEKCMEETESDKEADTQEDDVDEKQKKEIRKAIERILNGEELTDQEKGNLGEMLMDQYYISKGYKPLHQQVTSLRETGHKGIDGVYEKDGKFMIADAKCNHATLQDTKDGRQMSWNWINERLDQAVGKEKADEIRDAYEDDPENISTEVYHYSTDSDAEGNTYSDVYKVDADGYKVGNSEQVERYDRNGNREDYGGNTDA